MTNPIDRMPELLNRYPAQVRLAALAIVPAFLVFMAMLLIRSPAPPPPIVVTKTVDASPAQHILTKAEFTLVSQLGGKSQEMLRYLDGELARPAGTKQEGCLTGLRGNLSYIDTILFRLRQDVATSASMKNADDEKYVNANIASVVTASVKILPTLSLNSGRMLALCPNDTVVEQDVKTMQGFFGQAHDALKRLQDRLARQQ